MGLFSFGNKDDTPRRRGANARSARAEARSRRTERAGDADAMLLDPTLPEKQRARRRLVGAIALVVAAVVILPMVLDSHPKPVTDDIAIDIPSRPATVPSRARDDASDSGDAQAGVAPDSASGPAAAAATSGPASSAEPATRSGSTDPSAKLAAKSASATQQARASTASKAPAAAAQMQSAKEATASASSTKSTSTQDAGSGSPTAPPGARFAVQLGVFADDANAKRWEGKLKAAGVPAYIEHRKQADGSTRSMLRAGPFADRAAATAAIAKVREAGLTANSAQ